MRQARNRKEGQSTASTAGSSSHNTTPACSASLDVAVISLAFLDTGVGKTCVGDHVAHVVDLLPHYSPRALDNL